MEKQALQKYLCNFGHSIQMTIRSIWKQHSLGTQGSLCNILELNLLYFSLNGLPLLQHRVKAYAQSQVPQYLFCLLVSTILNLQRLFILLKSSSRNVIKYLFDEQQTRLCIDFIRHEMVSSHPHPHCKVVFQKGDSITKPLLKI